MRDGTIREEKEEGENKVKEKTEKKLTGMERSKLHEEEEVLTRRRISLGRNERH